MKRIAHMASLTLAGIALAAGGFLLGRTVDTDETPAGPQAPATGPERKVLYWHDPMVPGPRFDKPGKSPFMDMQLVPVYADEAAASGVRVAPEMQQSLGIRTAAAARTEASASFDAIGTVQFDERLSAVVQSRVPGYVEKLSVRATQERVRRGQALATLFAPEWLGPQNEYLALKRSGAAPDIVAAARERMQAMSIPEALIRQAEASGAAQSRFTLSSPVDGVVAELGVREGAAVAPGMTLFRIAGLQKVWAVAEIPEAQAVRLQRGQPVKAVLQADESQAFEGRLEEILPQVSGSTRTLQARFGVDNRVGRLTPGMLLRLRVGGPTGHRLTVPAEAVIRTGTRAVAIVRRDDGRFEPRELALGADLGDRIEITRGLEEGEQVVVSGQFLVDSEARLKSVLGAMAATPSSGPSPATAVHVAEGQVESIETDGMTISHGPVPSLKWPAMTMGFGKADPSAFPGIRPGDAVRFEFRQGGPLGHELVSVRRIGGTR